MPEITAKRLRAGYSPYNRLLLAVYDPYVRFNYRFLWGCHSHRVLDLYNEHVSGNHLDVGVATGTILDHCTFPSPSPRLALMDLNPNSLHVASKRLARYHPETYLRNILDPIKIDTPPFDSVGLANLLHCLPGTMKTKRVVFGNLNAVLNPGGTLFGCTILNTGMKRNPLARLTLCFMNSRGHMSIREDDLKTLEQNLTECFAQSSVKVEGCMALFWARK